MRTWILGILQGLTEFLPVSSSGHLVIAQSLLGINPPGIALEVMLHLATLLAIVVYFNKELLEIFNFKEGVKRSLLFLLVIGSIPAAVVGLLAKDVIERFFEGTFWPSIFLIINGFILFTTLLARERKTQIGVIDAFLVGVAQALAILPGISRSGSTITVALLLGIKREEAFKFSFFLSLPAILGATALKIREGLVLEPNFALGFVLAFAFGVFSLFLLRKLVIRGKLVYFGLYTILLGALTLLFTGW